MLRMNVLNGTMHAEHCFSTTDRQDGTIANVCTRMNALGYVVTESGPVGVVVRFPPNFAAVATATAASCDAPKRDVSIRLETSSESCVASTSHGSVLRTSPEARGSVLRTSPGFRGFVGPIITVNLYMPNGCVLKYNGVNTDTVLSIKNFVKSTYDRNCRVFLHSKTDSTSVEVEDSLTFEELVNEYYIARGAGSSSEVPAFDVTYSPLEF
jgi:hypothetical protein